MSVVDRPQIDFDELRRIDAEMKQAVANGTWTEERFRSLWQRGMTAANNNTYILDFITIVAAPTWHMEGQGRRGAGMRPIPSDVTTLVNRLRAGWVPSIVLNRSTSFAWNGVVLPSARVDIPLTGSRTLIGRCSMDDASALERDINAPAGSIVETRCEARFRGDWHLTLHNAGIAHLSRRYGSGECIFELGAGHWEAFRGSPAATPPRLWCGLVSGPDIRFGNMMVNGARYVSWAGALGAASHHAWGHLCLSGTYTSYLISLDKARGAAIVIDCEDQSLAERVLFREVEALQFVLGQRVDFDTLFAVDGKCEEVIGARHLQRRPAVATSAGLVIPDADLRDEALVADYFRPLSAALAESNLATLHLAFDAYLGSNTHIDGDALALMNALNGLAHHLAPRAWRERDKWLAWVSAAVTNVEQTFGAEKTPEIVRILESPLMPLAPLLYDVLKEHGIHLREGDLDIITSYQARLSQFGMLTASGTRDRTELRAELDLLELLRTLVVALVALIVGYHGPIRSRRGSPDVPDWWPFKTGSGRERFTASMAPHLVNVCERGGDIVTIFVGPSHHVPALKRILSSAGFPDNRFSFVIGENEASLVDLLDGAPNAALSACVVSRSPIRHARNALDCVRRDLKVPTGIEVCPAVPSPEAWLLADDKLVQTQASGDQTLEQLAAELPPPDEITDPHAIASQLLGPPETWDSLEYDVYRAAGRSWSLRHFLTTIAALTGLPITVPIDGVARTITREVLASIVRELFPSDTVVWRTSDGTSYAADALTQQVETGTPLGIQYAREVLEVAIDLLARQARKNQR